MKTILVTGSNGLLGQKLTDYYRGDASTNLIATGRGEDRYPNQEGYVYTPLDITDKAQVKAVLEAHKPDVVIHGAAMTNVDACELDPDACQLFNVEATKYIVDACNSIQAHLVFVSTDFIFDGSNGPYKEEDTPNPLSIYGQSKLDAETYVREKAQSWAIARTVLVYGIVADMSRSNIVLWAKKSLEDGTAIKVVDDQFRTPTLAEDLAQGCILIADQMAKGVYNISGKDFMSIYDLVQRVALYFALSMEGVERISSETLNQPAKRPPVTGFDLTKSMEQLGYQPRSFEEGIALMMEQIKKQNA